MSKSLNKVQLIGNVGRNPETRHTSGGSHVTTLSVCTNAVWKDAGGNKQERAEWHRVTCWGKLAEIAEKYCHSGKQIYIEGELRNESWEKDGETHYSTFINALDLILLGGK